MTNDAINVDSIAYIEGAKKIQLDYLSVLSEGRLFWFYSALIAALGNVLNISLENSAFSLNAIFMAFSVSILTRISYLLSEHKRVVAIATMVLVLINPHLNEYRAYIIRDPGFWMFFLWGMLALIQYHCENRLRYAIYWGLVTSFSALFRVEGVVFLMLTPLLVFFNYKRPIVENIKYSAPLYIAPLMLFAIAIGLYYSFELSLSFHGIGLLNSDGFVRGLFNELSNRASILNDSVFDGMSEGPAIYSLLAALLMIVFIKILFVATPLYVGMSFYGLYVLYKSESVNKYTVVFWYSIISLSILVGFSLNQYFLQGRYVIPLTFCIILLASHSLPLIYDESSNIWTTYSDGFRKGVVFVISLWLIVLVVDGLVSFGVRKDYIRHAGHWLNDSIPKTERLWINNPVLIYYSGRAIDAPEFSRRRDLDDDIANERVPSLKDGVLALRLRRGEMAIHHKLVKSEKYEVIKEFSNKRGDKVYVYKIH